MHKETVIEVNHVIKEYNVFSSPLQRLVYSLTKMKKFTPKKFTAVNDLSFEVKKGEILGIIGRNGAGKSTVLKLITGVSFPTTGKLEVKGRISSLLELGAGFNPEMTGLENIIFQGNLLGLDRQEMEKRLPAILEFAEIGDFVYQPVKNYSSGMFARIAFATAIHVDPDILIVDEVLAVGDIAFQFKCIEKMKEFASNGVTILFVTHSMMSLYRFCDRAIWIDKGTLLMDGTVEEVVPIYEDELKKVKRNETKAEEVRSLVLDFKQSDIYVDNKVVQKVGLHDDFSFKASYDLLEDLEEAPYFALSIVKDGMNYDVFGVFPSNDDYTLPKEKGTYEVEVELRDHNLNNGEYDIYFSVLEKNGISHLYFGQAIGFEVTGEVESLGVVNIEHQVGVKKLSK